MIASSPTSIVNINAAKKLAFVIVILLVFWKSCSNIKSEPCKRLLKSGRLVDNEHWQPDGCMLHEYNERDTRSCLKGQRIAFVGDSRLREILFTLIEFTTPTFEKPEKGHSNISFTNDEMDLKFYWAPELNQSAKNLYEDWKQSSDFPSVIVQAAATHTIKRCNGSSEALESYRTNLTALLPLMKEVADKKSRILWIMQGPVAEHLLHKARRAITNQQIDSYNRVASNLFETQFGQAVHSGIFVVRSVADVVRQMLHTTLDGLHHGEEAKHHIMQIFLNAFCNEGQSKFGLCCQKSPPFTITQIIAFAIGCLCILGAILARLFIKDEEVKGENGEVAKKSNSAVYKQLITAAAKMSLILFYFYICDRTDIFMKSNKHFASIRFFIPLLYVFFVGIFAIDQCKTPSLLNRDQTDEWKGWMQLVILIYHVTGASANIPIYMHVRLLVAMYLFMTGYGHFSYFWHKGDFSFYRVFNVLFRLNFLTVMLCIVMNRPYQFYYFVPLCTFWFLLLYLAMAMWPRAYDTPSTATTCDSSSRSTSPIRLMSFKLLCFALAINLLFISQKIFEFLFSWWPAITLFELGHGSVREWWFRCQLDRFAVLHGAVFCFVYLLLNRLNILDDSKQGCLLSTKGSLITVSSAIVVLLGYMLWAVQCTDKVQCNHIHSYASFLPISAFILIRNIPGYLRSHYSSFFAWFGKISLELFIGQYHIWLAADTKGILVLGFPNHPTADLVLATFIFVCAAHEINSLTAIFAKHFMGSPKDGNKRLAIRCLLAVATLIAFLLPSYLITNPFH